MSLCAALGPYSCGLPADFDEKSEFMNRDKAVGPAWKMD